MCMCMHTSINSMLRFESQNLQLGMVDLCRSVIRSIETARTFDFEEFPTRDKVRQNYFICFADKFSGEVYSVCLLLTCNCCAYNSIHFYLNTSTGHLHVLYRPLGSL